MTSQHGQKLAHIRAAVPADVPTILRLIRELAAYEREFDKAVVSEADLLRDGWCLAADGSPLPAPSPPRFRALIAECAGEPAGFALFFTSYSRWLGRHGLRLEDIYVTPARRGEGVGKALFAELARIALQEGCQRLEWDVLTWNEPALGFYRRLGATTQEAWRTMRLSGEALAQLANTADPLS